MGAKIEVRNPRTGETDHWIEPPSPGELASVAGGLRAAQPAWDAAGLEARIAAMQAWREAIARRRDEILEALVADTGRLTESVLEIDAILRSIERWCGLAPQLIADEAPRPSSIPIVSVAQGSRPYQLAGVISPWNFPLLLSLIDAVPALLAGCAVLVKPSEIAPRFIEPLVRAIGDVPSLEPVLAYVAGAGETGAEIVDLVDVVCFTGSVPTGRRVGEQAARRFIPAFLELGGKDPAIVLSTADLERATSAILWGATANAGQSCLSIERVYVDDAIAGNVHAWMPAGKFAPLFGFEGYNVARAIEVDGGYDLLTREAVFYLDPRTGEILERWANPYTGADVEVLHVWNDPVNQQLRLAGPRGPWRVPVTGIGDDVFFNVDVFLAYPSPLPRAQFPENSQDDLYQAAELFQFFCKRTDLEDPAAVSVPSLVSWTRLAPWLPWMAMGDRPGQLVYHCRGAKLAGGYADLPAHIRSYVEAHGAQFATAPREFTAPNETSWTTFKRMRAATPAKG